MGAHSRQAAMVVRGAGTHTVRVSAIYTDSAYNGALYSSSILIQNWTPRDRAALTLAGVLAAAPIQR